MCIRDRYRKVTFELDITERIKMEADLAEANERLAHLAAHDLLTGLPNHHRSRELIDQAVEQAERYGRGERAAVALGLLHRLVDELAAAMVVGQPGQQVVSRQMGQAFVRLGEVGLHLDALGDVELEGHLAIPVSYTHLRAHETVLDLVCR